MKINDIYYSIQGEGYDAGRPSIFIRLSGCNQNCSFCDTNHFNYEDMTPGEVQERVKSISQTLPIIITGGEPLLQQEELLEFLELNYNARITIETNGTIAPNFPPEEVYRNWIHLSVSPKIPVNELPASILYYPAASWSLKLLYPFRSGCTPHDVECLPNKPAYRFIQPIIANNYNNESIYEVINILKEYPKYRLSLQSHKFIGVK